MFGTVLSIPVPDLDRTDYLLMLGANPLGVERQPDDRARHARAAAALRARGGKVVVIDPRRSRTADEADAHHFIRPGTDAHLLFAIVHMLFAEGRVALGRLAEHIAGLDEVERAGARRSRPRPSPTCCGIDADVIRRLARELAAARGARPSTAASAPARRSSARSRAGSSTCINVLTGNLDRAGGAMFPKAAAGSRERDRHARAAGAASASGAAQSRVRGLPRGLRRAAGGVPGRGDRDARRRARCAALDHGRRQPGRLARPTAARLDAARSSSSTSWSASTSTSTRRPATPTSILPAPSPLERSHYDVALYQLAVRNVAKYSPPLVAARRGRARRVGDARSSIAGVASGLGPNADVDALDDFMVAQRRRARSRDAGLADRGPRSGRACSRRSRRGAGPIASLDLMLAHRAVRRRVRPARGRTEPRAPRSGTRTASTSARSQPRLPEVLRTPSGKIELAPPGSSPTSARLRAALARGVDGAGADRPPHAALEQLLDAQPRRAGEGQGRAARCTSTPTTRDARARRRRRRPRALAGRRARDRRWRSPTRSCPAWSASRTAGATTYPASALGVAAAHAGANSQPARRRGRDRSAVRATPCLNGIPVSVEPVVTA